MTTADPDGVPVPGGGPGGAGRSGVPVPAAGARVTGVSVTSVNVTGPDAASPAAVAIGQPAERLRHAEHVMGTVFSFDIPAAAAPVLPEVVSWLHWVDATFSTYRADSDVSRFGRGEVTLAQCAPELAEVIGECAVISELSDGYFTDRPGGRFDPSGLVKGWAIERASSILDGYGYRHYFVEAAGDIRTRHPVGTGGPWRIGIRHPVERNKVARVVLANDLAVATSGTYEKGAHVRDPHTGRQVREWLSFTVIGSEIVKADVYATAALAMGQRGVEFIEALPCFEAYAIDPQLRATWTSGFSALSDSGEGASG